jgi:hypothetical protein
VVAQMNAMRSKGASWAMIAATERPGHQISGSETACQQCGGHSDPLSCAEEQWRKEANITAMYYREANDGLTTRHIVVEETAGVIHIVIPKSEHWVFRELPPETDRQEALWPVGEGSEDGEEQGNSAS